jgi:Na+-transporting NADH:ubiquinone oxidoreductase subunit C
MAINKESNAYTFTFSIILVAVVGAILSSLSLGLKPYQDKNKEVKKQMDILSAIGVESDRSNATELYKQYIPNSFVISADGQELNDQVAFNIDVQKQIRDKTIKPKDRVYPIYEAQKDGESMYVLPVVGKGLWGPIWGYIALGSDKETILGASFDHKTETPGLGAEINQSDFEDRYIGGKIQKDGQFVEISVVKDGSGSSDDQKVDGITGGTITSKGVEEMMNRTMRVYQSYFSTKSNS